MKMRSTVDRYDNDWYRQILGIGLNASVSTYVKMESIWKKLKMM